MPKFLDETRSNDGRRPSRFTGRRSILKGLAGITLASVLPRPARAQSYPARVIRLIVPYPAGGSGDFVGRLYAEYLSNMVGKTVIVENVPGAGTNIGADQAARSEPDGYTLLLGTSQAMVNEVFGPVPMSDPLKLFEPIGLITELPFVVAANPRSGIASVEDLVRLAKTKPEQVTLAHAQFQAQASLLRQTIGENFLVVPYRGGAQALTDVIGGQVSMLLSLVPVLKGSLEGKNLVAIGVASKNRLSSIPDVRTFAEQGYPRFTTAFWMSVLAPKGTPASICSLLTQHTQAMLENSNFVRRLKENGGEPLKGNAEQTTAKMIAEAALWKSVPAETPNQPK
jgi:tripartite-type tricarboxylate transporter receptor subunit TctC